MKLHQNDIDVRELWNININQEIYLKFSYS